jgi:hypothetical protein
MRGSSKLKRIGSWDCEFSHKIKIIHSRKLTDLDDQNSQQKETGTWMLMLLSVKVTDNSSFYKHVHLPKSARMPTLHTVFKSNILAE